MTPWKVVSNPKLNLDCGFRFGGLWKNSTISPMELASTSEMWIQVFEAYVHRCSVSDMLFAYAV